MACTAKRWFRCSELDIDAFGVIGEDREKVLVGGGSSGSNLAAGVALRDMEVVSAFNGHRDIIADSR
jgi:acetyl esterase/lipase